MFKFIGIVIIVGLGVYYVMDNTVSHNLIQTYCKRSAQEKTVRLPLEALTIRDRASEQEYYEVCAEELEDASVLQVLVKSLQRDDDSSQEKN